MITKLTLDRAGRFLIRKQLRQELHLGPGDTLQMESEGQEITLSYRSWLAQTLRPFAIDHVGEGGALGNFAKDIQYFDFDSCPVRTPGLLFSGIARHEQNYQHRASASSVMRRVSRFTRNFPACHLPWSVVRRHLSDFQGSQIRRRTSESVGHIVQDHAAIHGR